MISRFLFPRKAETPKLHVKRPCAENTDNMQPTADGLYCQSCKHLVHDFRDMSTEQIITFIQSRNGEKVCGIFQPEQATVPVRHRLFRYAAAVSIALFGAKEMQAAEIHFEAITEAGTTGKDSVVWRVTGKITDIETGAGLYYATISFWTNKGWTELHSITTKTDGTFECNITTLKDQTVKIMIEKRGYLSVKQKDFNPASGKLEIRLKRDPKYREPKYKVTGCPSF